MTVEKCLRFICDLIALPSKIKLPKNYRYLPKPLLNEPLEIVVVVGVEGRGPFFPRRWPHSGPIEL